MNLKVTRRGLLVGGIATAVFGRKAAPGYGAASQPATRVCFDAPNGACDCHTHVFCDSQRFPFWVGAFLMRRLSDSDSSPPSSGLPGATGMYVLLAWLPSYFREVLHLSVASSGLFLAGPWLTAAAVTNVAAPVSDRLIAGGFSVTATRKLMQCGGSPFDRQHLAQEDAQWNHEETVPQGSTGLRRSGRSPMPGRGRDDPRWRTSAKSALMAWTPLLLTGISCAKVEVSSNHLIQQERPR